MSASDLAPFVAAVIEDGIAAELQRKNAEQKRKIETLESTIQQHESERLLVQITGRHSAWSSDRPIYGERSLKEGRGKTDFYDQDTLWLLDIDNEDDAFICPFDKRSITQLEIRVGGMLILPRFLQHLTVITNFDYEEHEDEDDLNKLVYLNHVAFSSLGMGLDPDDDCPINRLTGRIGPITVRHYKALCNLPEGAGIEISDLLEHTVLRFPTTAVSGAQPVRKMTLTVQAIEFHKKNISGCISLMEQLGIRTRAPRRS